MASKLDTPMESAQHESPSAARLDYHPDDTFLRRHRFQIVSRRGDREAIWGRHEQRGHGQDSRWEWVRYGEREAFDRAYAEDEATK